MCYIFNIIKSLTEVESTNKNIKLKKKPKTCTLLTSLNYKYLMILLLCLNVASTITPTRLNSQHNYLLSSLSPEALS